MSYDVDIGNIWLNYTSNMSVLFYNHCEGNGKTGLHAIDGLTGYEAAPILHKMMTNIEKERIELWENYVVGEPKFCEKYDSPNGWGSLVGQLLFIGQIATACLMYPDEKIKVSS